MNRITAVPAMAPIGISSRNPSAPSASHRAEGGRCPASQGPGRTSDSWPCPPRARSPPRRRPS